MLYMSKTSVRQEMVLATGSHSIDHMPFLTQIVDGEFTHSLIQTCSDMRNGGPGKKRLN
jgi:hypothetical protein